MIAAAHRNDGFGEIAGVAKSPGPGGQLFRIVPIDQRLCDKLCRAHCARDLRTSRSALHHIFPSCFESGHRRAWCPQQAAIWFCEDRREPHPSVHHRSNIKGFSQSPMLSRGILADAGPL